MANIFNKIFHRQPNLINVTKNDDLKKDLLIWEEDLTKAENGKTLTLEQGLQAKYLVNGRLKARLRGGSQVEIESADAKLPKKLIVVYTATFEIPWGVGGIVINDRRATLQAKIGMHGKFTLSIAGIDNAVSAFGTQNIKAPMIQKVILNSTEGIIGNILKNNTSLNPMSGPSIQDSYQTIAEQIKQQCEKTLLEKGLILERVDVCPELCIDDEYKKAKSEDLLRAREQNVQNNEIDHIASVASRLSSIPGRNNNYSTTATIPTNNNANTVSFCPRCGKPIEQDNATCCPHCGRML